MIAPYVDLVKDTVVVVLLITVSGIKGFFSDDVTHFSNVVILILLATVTVPLFVSAVRTSARHPLTIFEFSLWRKFTSKQPGKWKLAFIRLVVFVCYIFVPAILILNKCMN